MTPTKVLAIILAGGSGSRMNILTDARAKPALPFAGVYRLIDIPLSNCVHSAISDVWIVEQFQSYSLNEHLLHVRPWDLDRTYGGLRIMPPYQGTEHGGWHQGNADALYRNSRFIREFDPALVVVLSTDDVYRFDYRQIIDAHLATGATVTMVTAWVSRDQAHRLGVVQTDGARVVDVSYKPDRPASDTVTTESFVYSAQPLLDVLEELADRGKQNAALKDFGHELLPRLVKEGNAFAVPIDGYWRDLGTPSANWEAHMDLLAETAPLRLDDPAWPIRTADRRRQAARLYGGAEFDNSLIGAGCEIHGNVVRSILGPGVVVSAGAGVEDSVIFHDTVLEANVHIHTAIIDSGIHVGQGAQIGAARSPDTGRIQDSAITLVGRGAQIHADARIAVGARIAPEPRASHAVAHGDQAHPKRRERT